MTLCEAAKVAGIPLGVACRIRLETIGKTETRKKETPAGKLNRRKRLMRLYAVGRKKRFVELISSRIELSRDASAVPKPCSVCRRPWFKTPKFYTQNRKLGKYWAACKSCQLEIARLKKQGMSNAESRSMTAGFSWFPARVSYDYDELMTRFINDSNHHCGNPLLPCRRCEKRWYWNRNYFHVGQDTTNRCVLLDVCLECSA